MTKSFAVVLMIVAALQNELLLAAPLLDKHRFTSHDAILVTEIKGASENLLVSHQPDMPLIPASLSKLATTYLAIKQWGLGHRFRTDVYLDGQTLWVKGFGDPFLISEEIAQLAVRLRAELTKRDVQFSALGLDDSIYQLNKVPGRSGVADPYNAPLSAIAANFNTAFLQRTASGVISAEPQTPLTATAVKMASTMSKSKERVNLRHKQNALSNFAELLFAKMNMDSVPLVLDKPVPEAANLLFSYYNSHSLEHLLRGTLEYSNNFIANLLFLNLLSEEQGIEFNKAQQLAETSLQEDFAWHDFVLEEGAGLSRENRLSARQIHDLLRALTPHRSLLKRYDFPEHKSQAFAKTGTLNGVRSFAGYIEVQADTAPRLFMFVFNFNRSVPYQYRETLLNDLVSQLAD